MKEGWTYKKLGEVCDILDYMRKPITKGKREAGIIPYYGATGCLDYVKDYIFDEKLVLLGEDGAKWGAGEASSYIIEGKSWVNNHAHALRPRREILLDEILVYFLNYSNLLPYITGVTVPKLNQEKMRSINIPIVPIKEQQRIVERLDSAFENIDKLKANAEKQLAEARTLFQKSLAKAMEPKEGWEEFSFGELIKLQSGDYLPSKYMINGKYPVYGGNGIAGYHNQYNRDGGKIVIGRVGALCGNVHYITTPFWLTDNGFEVLLLKNIDIDFKYLSFYLNFLELGKYARQTAQPVISNASLKDVKLFLPSYTVQQRIVERLDALSENIRKYEEIQRQMISECDALKQALLRKVFE